MTVQTLDQIADAIDAEDDAAAAAAATLESAAAQAPKPASTAVALTQTTSGIVSAREWNSIVSQANTLAKTQIVPKPFRNRPEDIVAVAMIGRELGLSAMMAMQYINIIEGKPSVQPELMNARIRAAGHAIRVVEWTDEVCKLRGIRADSGEALEVSFSMQDAIRAQITTTASGKPGAWQKFPRAMLWARCLSMLGRALFPDVMLGARYTPEELGAIVDAEGAVIDDDDAEDVDIVSETFAEPEPPPPLSPEEQHAKNGEEQFPRGWPMGAFKGMPPSEVDDEAVEYFIGRADVNDPKYGAKNRAQVEWCKAELARRRPDTPAIGNPAEASDAPMSQIRGEALMQALVDNARVDIADAEAARVYVEQLVAERQPTNEWADRQIKRLQETTTA